MLHNIEHMIAGRPAIPGHERRADADTPTVWKERSLSGGRRS
jgi:hypothetical protein